jgi:glycosyltransferase involved in cell wall biosynthesis
MTLVSVIVTTRNEESNIRRCLLSIKRQTYKNIEIIVVDNNSTDRTKEIAREFTPSVYNLGPERCEQRNFGISESRGLIVLYIDADMALSPEVVAQCVSAFDRDPDIVGLYIPERVVGRGFWIKVRDHERSFYDATPIDAVRAIRRRTFDEVGGFDVDLTGVEDWDFDVRVRHTGKTMSIEAPVFHNENGFDLKTYLKKKSYYGQSFDTYRTKWGTAEERVSQQFDFFYRYFIVFIEHHKYLRLLAHPILTLGMYYLRVAVGLSYLREEKNRPRPTPTQIDESSGDVKTGRAG